jgi:hypothetical protein
VDETCGGCRFFKVTRERDDGRLGECRLQKIMGIFRDSMRACGAYARVGGPDVSPTDTAVRRPRATAPGGEPTRVGATALAASLGALSAETLKTLLAEAPDYPIDPVAHAPEVTAYFEEVRRSLAAPAQKPGSGPAHSAPSLRGGVAP